ncbi:precorrin-3B synthase, partial [Blastococcus sp. CT_GayMR20]
MTVPRPPRDRVDACPGALQTHPAADGALARVRVPGGALTRVQLRTLSAAARELGDGTLELTSRGNVQLRRLRAGSEPELGDRLAAVGLLPSATHETARNVVASVLSGRVG